jgi:tetratricopeptide (TPR) repeat protein
MRKAEPDDQRFTEFTDHWIRKRIDLPERDHRTDYTVVPAFPDVVAELPEGEREYYLGRANFLLAMDVPASRRPPMWAEADRRFTAAIEAGFDRADAWFFLGKTRLYAGSVAGAQEAFAEAVAREPEHHDANFALGQALYQLGRIDEAGAVFEAKLERQSDDTMALAEYARVAWTQKRYGEALDYYSRATALEPWNPTLQLNYGMSFASMSRFDEAAKAGEAATALDPDDPGVWNLYHNAMREAGRAHAAREGQRQYERMSGIPEHSE